MNHGTAPVEIDMFNEIGASPDMFVSSATMVAGRRAVRARTSAPSFRVVMSAVIGCVAASFFVWSPPGRSAHQAPEGHYTSSARDDRVQQFTKSTVGLRLVHDSRIISRLMRPDDDEGSMVDPDHGM